MKSCLSPISLFVALAALITAQSCPSVHIFGARGTGVPPGYDLLLPLVNQLKSTYAGATSEAIVYPACGGATTAVNNFHNNCPNTKLVLMGYSQGGQIIDDALCGGPDPNAGITDASIPISASAVQMVKAAIFMGDPRFQYGFPYEIGTCKLGGFAARPKGFACTSGSKIQSYCDSADPYCCQGNDTSAHGAYVNVYGQNAIAFIEAKLNS
ncbi:carbohydrate esterase family 5 protein [Trichoderma chlorosporum]